MNYQFVTSGGILVVSIAPFLPESSLSANPPRATWKVRIARGRLNLLRERTAQKQTEKSEPDQMFPKMHPSLPLCSRVVTDVLVFMSKNGTRRITRSSYANALPPAITPYFGHWGYRYGAVAGRPVIARKTSKTNSPIAISLNRVAWRRVGQS